MKKKVIVVLCLVLALSLALAGCTPKPTPTPSGNEGQNTPEPAAKTEMTAAVTADFDSIDPQIMLASDTDRIMYNVYEGLAKCGADGNIKPGLAESWTFDGDTFVFKIRKGVKFHDGQDLTADDVVYSYKRMSGMIAEDQSAVKQAFQEGIASIEKTGDYEVTIKLSKTNTAFEANLLVSIIKDGAGPTIIATPNGTGPYKLASYEPGVGCKLEKFEDYWGTKANIDVINVKMYSDTTASLLAMQNGEIQMSAVTEANLEMVPDTFNKLFISNNTPILVQVNCKEGVFSDVRVRQALNYATDQKALIDALCPGSEWVSGYLTKLQTFYQKDNTGMYPYSPDKANELLAQAGYTADKKCKFDLMWFSNLSNYYESVSLVLKSQWDKTNFDCTLVDTDWSTFLSTVYSNPERKYDAALFGYTGKLDPFNQFRRLLSTNNSNIMMFKSEEYDKLLDEVSNTTDASVKQKAYHRMQDIIAEEAVGVWLHDNYGYIALDKNYDGYTPYVITFWDFSTIKKVN